ncbi:ribonuclease E/G [Fusibacter bizertensis]|uniref:Ribonuclease E/G n=1 Tax=Fusibacter bizertensis TaxID=1488331 RepID=A0ABT6ND97_9FIRM|nr:ribonuclease E/G [Fusibacter bizertensis]MDH8678366.1 ribonuclease E/G [Fusibacter bizertensis]
MKIFTLDRSPILSIASIFDNKTKQIEALFIENLLKPNRVGDIFTGKVISISDGMESAFIDIGLSSNCFIQRGELLRGLGISPNKVKGQPLSKLVKKGQMVLVQVEKAPYQTKGAQLTADVSLPGNYVVLMPKMNGVRISRKIEKTEDLASLELKMKSACKGFGLILRSGALKEGVTHDEIISEISSLVNQWEKILQAFEITSTVKCLYQKNILQEEVEEMLTEHPVDVYSVTTEEDKKWLLTIGISKQLISLKSPDTSLLIEHGVSLDQLLYKEKWETPEGVTVVLNELEAFTIIDVNSAKYVMDSKKRDSVFKVNAIAAAQILQKIKLLNISGIILIDFIDMLPQEQLSFTQHLLNSGYDKSNQIVIEDFTSLGILQLTKKRELPTIKDLLSFDYAERDLNYYQLYQLYLELKRTEKHTNTKQLKIELEDALYVFLRQNNLISDFNFKIELKHSFKNQNKFKIQSVKH